MREINEIIIHCTATKEGIDYSIGDIRAWHKKRGFTDIGYHFVIYRDGSVLPGRSIDIPGAHTAGHNKNSIGICYVGGLDVDGKPKDTRTDEQKTALVKLLAALIRELPNCTIYGHNEYARKACPCFDVKSWLTEVKSDIWKSVF